MQWLALNLDVSIFTLKQIYCEFFFLSLLAAGRLSQQELVEILIVVYVDILGFVKCSS